MKKHKKKCIGTFIVGLVLSIMITPFCFYKLSEPVSALSNVITYNSYGSFERVNLKASILNTGVSMAGVVGNLQGKYSGSLTIYIDLNGHSISDFSVVPDNCWITYYSSSQIDIQFNDISQFQVLLTSTTLDATAQVTISSLTNWNMNMITYGDNYMQQHIYTSVDQIEGYIDNVESLLTTNNSTLSRCETLLTTISQNGGSGGSSTVNNIDINVDHIADDLSLLKASNDSILDELLGFLTDGLGHVLTIENVIDAIESTTTALTGISTQLTSIGSTLTNISNTLNNINTAVQNIDNSIDTISWTKLNSLSNQYKYGTSLNSLTDFSSNITIRDNTVYIQPTFYYLNSAKSDLIKIHLPLAYNASDIKNLNVSVNNGQLLYKNIAYNQLDIYVLVNHLYVSQYLQLNIEVTKNKSNDTFTLNSSLEIYKINDSDIEYWQLLQYFDQYNMQREILTALQQLSINVNGDIIQQTEQVINNYDTNFNTIHNIESNFTNNFDSTNPGVISLLNTNLQIPNGFVEGSNFVKVLFPKVVDNSSLVGFPYFLILAIVVLIVLLG